MATYANDVQRLSNWLKYEEEAGSGVTREVLSRASVTDATITGSVLDSKGKLVVKATVADATYILIDDLTTPAQAEYKQGVLVLARGHAKVGKEALIFGDDVLEADKAAAFAALKAKNIFAVSQLKAFV